MSDTLVFLCLVGGLLVLIWVCGVYDDWEEYGPSLEGLFPGRRRTALLLLMGAGQLLFLPAKELGLLDAIGPQWVILLMAAVWGGFIWLGERLDAHGRLRE